MHVLYFPCLTYHCYSYTHKMSATITTWVLNAQRSTRAYCTRVIELKTAPRINFSAADHAWRAQGFSSRTPKILEQQYFALQYSD